MKKWEKILKLSKVELKEEQVHGIYKVLMNFNGNLNLYDMSDFRNSGFFCLMY